ncbi:hypothetical protein TRIP_E70018 [uncultured Spirochaetota bacterium]|uniref:Uncharacterized protein n=1 Tax=uncultured Spirochaetota bacterium TaxID=460511 RepID=A0A653A0G0_9SPIR|nr:hypothetical protein TRIP_E70018 [uncultured Spirochaetota bacterium]
MMTVEVAMATVSSENLKRGPFNREIISLSGQEQLIRSNLQCVNKLFDCPEGRCLCPYDLPPRNWTH